MSGQLFKSYQKIFENFWVVTVTNYLKLNFKTQMAKKKKKAAKKGGKKKGGKKKKR
jgi:hypothetical protein